jgi:Holliday junction resolvase
MSSISKGTIGAINELRIAQHLMFLGFGVFRCLSPNNPTDLIATKGRTVLKVQCKSSANGQWQNIRAGNNDLLVLAGLDGELRFRARTRRVARMFPACNLVRKPKRRK